MPSLKDELLYNEKRRRELIDRQKHDFMTAYDQDVRILNDQINSSIANALRSATVRDSYILPGLLFNKTIYRKHIHTVVEFEFCIHEKYKEKVEAKWIYDSYVYYVDIDVYQMIASNVCSYLKQNDILVLKHDTTYKIKSFGDINKYVQPTIKNILFGPYSDKNRRYILLNMLLFLE